MKNFDIKVGGAITLLNAIGIGKGAAIGTSLCHTVSISEGEGETFMLSPRSDEKLIKSCLKLFEDTFYKDIHDFILSTSLVYPAAKGMKTSSVVASSVMYLLGKFCEIEISIDQAILLGATASVNAGVSITGAIDDGYATFRGGYYVTDNVKQRVIAKHSLQLDKDVLFLVPQETTPKSTIQLELGYLEEYVLKKTLQDAIEGNWRNAIEQNSRVYSPYFLDDWEVIDQIEDQIEGTVGLNGAGPSLFIVCDPRSTQKNRQMLSDEYPEYEIHATSLRF